VTVLGSPQGTPERVWSLVAGLAALGGETDRQTFDALLNPGYMKDGVSVRANDILAANALGAASSLGLSKRVVMRPGWCRASTCATSPENVRKRA
jgi:hypothetical protein